MDQLTAIQAALPYSKQNHARLGGLYSALRDVDDNGIAGDFVECGVFKGSSTILARLTSPARRCWLYDTFAGMTAPLPVDVTRSGKSAVKKYGILDGKPWMAVSLEDVKANLRAAGVYDASKLLFVAGDVCDTVPLSYPYEIAVLRLDTDFYASTKACLVSLYPRLAKGGFLIVDDYGHWAGARLAVDEYFIKPVKWSYLDYSCVMVQK